MKDELAAFRTLLLNTPGTQNPWEVHSTDSAALNKVQNLLCDGQNPRTEIQVKILYENPSLPGAALDFAASTQLDTIDAYKKFLKEGYLQNAGEPNFELIDSGNPGVNRWIKTGIKKEKHVKFMDDSSEITIPYAEDIAYLMQNYAFILPKEYVTSRLNHQLQKSWSDPATLSWYGYRENSRHEMIWSASKSISNNKNIWAGVLSDQTIVQESPQPNGTILFQVHILLGAYCKYARPAVDLLTSASAKGNE